MSISTEHRGYTIRYDENQDSWGCYDCGVDEPTLSKAKDKIDAMHLKLRKKSALACFEIVRPNVEGHRAPVFTLREAKIIDYLGEEQKRSWMSSQPGETFHQVASVAKRTGDRAARAKTPLHQLVKDCPETHEKAAEIQRLAEEAHRARVALDAAIRDLPRVQIEDIAGLVEASDHRFEEGE